MDNVIVKEWLKEAPFTLSLSSGFFGFYAHLGFLIALEEENMIPEKITGSSAGALVGGLYASGVKSEVLKEFLFKLKKEDFWDPVGVCGILKGVKFRKILDKLIPVRNIEDCKIDLRLSSFNLRKFKTEVMDRGEVVDAVYASCAVPFMFQPLLKNKNIYIDGGVLDRPGIKGTIKGERVLYHHLISNTVWRKKLKIGTYIPKRRNLIAVSFKNLPKVRPNNLKNGVIAFNEAYKKTKKFLNLRMEKNNLFNGIIL